MVGVEGGYLPPGSLENPPQFHFTRGPANRFSHPGPPVPGEKEKPPGLQPWRKTLKNPCGSFSTSPYPPGDKTTKTF